MLTEQEKKALQQNIQSNKHEVYVVSFDEMDAIIKSSSTRVKVSVQESWQKVKGKVGFGASYYASADDIVTVTKLVGDLGSIGAKAYIKNYGGKPHIILKGRPGLRKVLTSPKYGIKNPKVITMGLGKAGAVAAAKQGGIISVVLLSAYRVADYLLTDEATLSQLIGTLATDVVKVGIVTGAAIVAASAVAGLTTVAIGPIVVVLVVGLSTSLLLEYMDNSMGITSQVIAGLDALGESAESYLEQQKNKVVEFTGEVADGAINYAITSAKSIAIKWIQNKIKNYLHSSY